MQQAWHDGHCVYVRIAASSLAHMQERGAGGDGGGGENPARPFPPRRRTVAASVAASVAAWPIEFNPRLSMIVDLSSSDAPKELLFPKGQVAL